MNSPTTLVLKTGANLPPVALGFWKVPRPETADLVERAIDVGYRHLDCAADYGNEAEVGAGLANVFRTGKAKRDDIWITSKLWNTYHRKEHVRPALERTLRDLGLDELDLYLIHFPIALQFVPFETRYPPEWVYDPSAAAPRMEADRVPIAETWGAMEELVRAGLVKNVGVCNFGVSLLRDLMNTAEIPPAVLQVELHPLLTQDKLVRYCQESGIAVTAFSPLGAQSYFSLNMARPEESLLKHPLIEQIAMAHERTPAQILLRWGVQRGTAVVPKTVRTERLIENRNLFDFSLSAEEMGAISGLNQNRRFNDPGVFCEQAFGSFFPIYE
ncbi:MAG: aldo/keto reductase [Planctomycetaceae bacterium]|nr:aldo/keto reductase [Planctomycetaceae bacterium]